MEKQNTIMDINSNKIYWLVFVENYYRYEYILYSYMVLFTLLTLYTFSLIKVIKHKINCICNPEFNDTYNIVSIWILKVLLIIPWIILIGTVTYSISILHMYFNFSTI